MNKPFTILLSVIASVFLLFVSVGFGYMYGAWNYYAKSTSSDAYVIVKTLEKLRAGKTTDAIQSLESTLDTKIIENSSYRPSLSKTFSIFVPTEEKSRLRFMKRVAEYRAKYPSVPTAPVVDELIGKHLNSFK